MDDFHLTSAEEEEQLPSGNAGRCLQTRPGIVGFDTVLQAWGEALPLRSRAGNPSVLHLYLNFPYCDRPCRYCQYWRKCLSDPAQLEAHVDYLCFQMDRLGRTLGRIEATTAYFGGGTPSLLSPEQWQRIEETFSRHFQVADEFTSEANPRSIDVDKLAVLARIGVNRLSLGVQALDPDVLETAGRGYAAPEHISTVVDRARILGMKVNLDLVAGLPGQSVQSFWTGVETLLAMAPDQLTIYRYKPVARLTDEPPPELRLDRLFGPAGHERCLRLGYRSIAPEDSHGYAVILFPENRTSAILDLRNALMKLLPWNDAAPHEQRYSLFDEPNSHLMGLGPGAFSHIYGHYWLREVTRLDRGVPDQQPIYVGSPYPAIDEARTQLMERFYQGDWVHMNTFARQLAVSRDDLFGPLLSQAGKGRSLQRFAGGIRIRPGASLAERRLVLESLQPDPEPADLSSLPYDLTRDQLADHVQTELVPFDVPQSGQTDAPVQSPESVGEALLALLNKLGVGPGGGTVGPFTFHKPSGHRVAVTIEADREPLIIEFLEAPTDAPAYLHTGTHALRYQNRPDLPLSSGEDRFLTALATLLKTT